MNVQELKVVADWCEERGFDDIARLLRGYLNLGDRMPLVLATQFGNRAFEVPGAAILEHIERGGLRGENPNLFRVNVEYTFRPDEPLDDHHAANVYAVANWLNTQGILQCANSSPMQS